MKFLILALVVACVQARPDYQGDSITRQESEVNPDSYHYAYETSGGIAAQEEGQLNTNAEYPSIAAKGSYKYTSPEGELIELNYVADENGFQPQGSHVPEIPEAIARSLQYIQTHQPPAPSNFPSKF